MNLKTPSSQSKKPRWFKFPHRPCPASPGLTQLKAGAAGNDLMMIKHLQNNQKWKCVSGEEGMGPLRTRQSSASLDKNLIFAEGVSGRVKVALGRGEQVSHHCSQNCSWHTCGHLPVPKQCPKHPFIAPSLTSLRQNPAALTGAAAPWQGPSLGPNWEKLEPCQVQHRQVLVAGVGF